MDKDNKKFPFEKERFEEKFPSKKETFVIRKKRRQILVLFLSFSGYILRGFHTYSRFHSLLISPIPLSTYHHPSETTYPSCLQNGDRLLLTYHLIWFFFTFCAFSPFLFFFSLKYSKQKGHCFNKSLIFKYCSTTSISDI